LYSISARRKYAAAFLALFLPFLAGCAHLKELHPQAGTRPGLLAATFDYSNRPPSDGRVHIDYWEKWTGFEADAMRAVVDAFNRSQNRVFVHMLTISQVDQKMLLATAGGNPPDVAGLWAYNVNVFADKNALLPLDSFIREAGIQPSDYIPCYWELASTAARRGPCPAPQLRTLCTGTGACSAKPVSIRTARRARSRSWMPTRSA